MHACMHAYIHTCMHTYTHIHTCIFHIHIHMLYICISIHTYILYTYIIFTYTRTFKYIYNIYLHTYICTHTFKCVALGFWKAENRGRLLWCSVVSPRSFALGQCDLTHHRPVRVLTFTHSMQNIILCKIKVRPSGNVLWIWPKHWVCLRKPFFLMLIVAGIDGFLPSPFGPKDWPSDGSRRIKRVQLSGHQGKPIQIFRSNRGCSYYG